MRGGGGVDDDNEKNYAHEAGEDFLYLTFFGENHHLFKGDHPLFTGKHFFHKRGTICNNFAKILFGKRKLRSLE